MKVFSLTLVLTILCFFPSVIFAQSIKKRGIVVANSGDSIKGFINYKNWNKNPRSIGIFSDSAGGTATTYQVADIQSVIVTGLDYYQKAIVTKDARPVKMGDLLPPEADSLLTDTVLLRTIVSGTQFELFELVDSKEHYFIKPAGGNLVELKYRLSVSENGSILTEKKYIPQLKALLSNQKLSPELLKLIDKASYREKDLRKVVSEMNGLDGSNIAYATRETSKRILAQFFVGAGVGISTLKLSGSYPAFNNMKFSSGFVSSIAAGVDISSARNLQDIVFRAELLYSTVGYKGTGSKQHFVGSNQSIPTTYAVQQSNIAPTLSIHYHFLRKENIRAYLGAGAGYSISFYSKNLYTEDNPVSGKKETKDFLDYPGGWMNISLKLGVKINHKIEADVNAQLTGSFTNYSLWGLSPNTYTAHVRYFF